MMGGRIQVKGGEYSTQQRGRWMSVSDASRADGGGARDPLRTRGRTFVAGGATPARDGRGEDDQARALAFVFFRFNMCSLAQERSSYP